MLDFLAKGLLQGLTKGPGGWETDSRVVEAGLAVATVILAVGAAKAMSDGHLKANLQSAPPRQPESW